VTTFIVDGQEKQIEMMVNGIDFSGDFIGNSSHGMKTDEEGRYIATQEDYKWWLDCVRRHEELEELIARYKEVYDADEIDLVVHDWITVDLEDQPDQVRLGLEQTYGPLGSKRSDR